MLRILAVKPIVSMIMFALLFLGASACASIPGRAKLELFEKTSKHYRIAILMSDFEQAAQLSASTPSKDFSDFKKFHVISYSPKKIEFSDDKSKAVQTVEIEYYRRDSMRQKVLRDLQEWIYQAETQQWILNSGLPQFD